MEIKMQENFNFYDSEHESIQEILATFNFSEEISNKEKAIEIYNYVRDQWYYSPLRISLIEEDSLASNLVKRKKGHCIDKSIILITILKAADIPARIGLAKIKNHIAVEQVVQFLGTDVLVPHGYVEIFLEDKWVKATPAFNKSLCDKLNVHTLEFNGEEDCIFQEYCAEGTNQFMEYIEDYGTFESFPVEKIETLLLDHYPILEKIGFRESRLLDVESMFS
jgi:hypothetical protein